MNKPNNTDTEERRRFFRIDDEVNLYYKKVDEEVVFTETQVTNDLLSNYSLVTALDVLDQEARLVMQRIEKNNPDVAEYLKIIDTKTSLIAQEAMRQDYDLSDSNICNVNISAAGIAFESVSKVNEGDFLEVKLLLTSCFAVIVIFGKVIYCNENKEEGKKPFQIGLDYINLTDQDREFLVKHVVKKQMQQIREQKKS
ncbi:MAG: PilZ domain-containing protein [Methylococcales bacterium]|nr:PilZ domain-containing protein [Methylococcales bacterium]